MQSIKSHLELHFVFALPSVLFEYFQVAWVDLSVVLYELIIRDKLTQKDLVEVTGMPKQSINKGIHYLKENAPLSKISTCMYH